MLTHEQVIGLAGLLASCFALTSTLRAGEARGKAALLASPLLALLYILLISADPRSSAAWFSGLEELGSTAKYWIVANGFTFILVVLGIYALLVSRLSTRWKLLVLDNTLLLAAYIMLIVAPWMGETLPVYPSFTASAYALTVAVGLGAGMASARIFLEKPEPSVPAFGIVLLLPALLAEAWRYASAGRLPASAPPLAALALLLSLIYSDLGFSNVLRRLSFLALGLMLVSAMPLLKPGPSIILTSKPWLPAALLAVAHVVFVGWSVTVRQLHLPGRGSGGWNPLSASLAATGILIALRPLLAGHPAGTAADMALYASLVVAIVSASLAFSPIRLPAWTHMAAAATASTLVVTARLAGVVSSHHAAGALLISITAGYASAIFMVEYFRLVRGRGEALRASIGFVCLALLLAGIVAYSAFTTRQGGTATLRSGDTATLCGGEWRLHNVSARVSEARVRVSEAPLNTLWDMLVKDAAKARQQLASLAEAYTSAPNRVVADLLLPREYTVSILSPGLVGYLKAESVASNASAEKLLEAPEPLLVWSDAKLYVGVEPANTISILRATLLVRDLVLPPAAVELLGTEESLMQKSLHHLYFVANFTQPLILRSARGWTLEVYSAMIGSSTLVGGRGIAEATLVGLRYGEAVVGVVRGAFVFNTTSIPVPSELGHWALEIQDAASKLRVTSPPLAQLVALEPWLIEALTSGEQHPSTLFIEVPLYARLNASIKGEQVLFTVSSYIETPLNKQTLKVERGLGACFVDVAPAIMTGPLGTRHNSLLVYYLNSMLAGDRWQRLGALALVLELEDNANLTGAADLYWLASNMAAPPDTVLLESRYNSATGLAWLAPWLVAAAAGIVCTSTRRRV